MRCRLAALFVLALAAASDAARAQTSSLQPAIDVPDEEERLRRDLRVLFSSPAIDHAQWGVHVSSLRTGETLYADNAFRFFVPASNQKLLTAAVAAERLGWDYQFTTRILATGALDPDGTLNGDVVVVGNGDPTINPRHPDRWRALDDWAAALRAMGIRIIGGHIIGDDNAFEEPGWGQGWAWDNLQYGYGAAVGALQYNENQIELMIGPGLAPGARAIISSSPLGHGLLIDHGVTTAATDAETAVDISRVPASTVLQVRGQIAAGAKPITLTASIDNPTRFYMNAFREALGRHGIFVGGSAADIDELRSAPDVTKATELLVDRSPKLSEIIDVTLKWSRNEYAETLLRALAPPGKPATAADGLEVLQSQLRTWGMAPESYLARDGSGLSRYDYVTADSLTWLLTYLWRDPAHAELFRAALPVAGASGTLAERMKGTPAENRVIAKTGSLSHVRALAGYLTTLEGEPIVFAILVNNFRVPAREIDAIVEKALVRLVEFKR